MKISDEDYKRYYKEAGDPGFNPSRNKAVIDKSIKKYEAMRRRKLAEHQDKLRERTDAVAQYLTSQHGAGSNKPVEKYFGKRTLAYLRGESIVGEIKERMRIINPSITKRDILSKPAFAHVKKTKEGAK